MRRSSGASSKTHVRESSVPCLDAVTVGLRNLPNVRLDQLPKMADFAIWVSACERVLGLELGEALESPIAPIAPRRAISHSRHRRFTNLSERWLGPDHRYLQRTTLAFEQADERQHPALAALA